jgi:cellulose synthase (UDP-forming)
VPRCKVKHQEWDEPPGKESIVKCRLKRLFKLSFSELRGILLVIAGLYTLGYYFHWWLQAPLLQSPWLIFGLLVAISYSGAQIFSSWLIYLATHHRRRKIPNEPVNLSVDVFVTVCGENYELVQQTLLAACAMHGEHRTWLLDDSHNPDFAELARCAGAGYLTRSDKKDAKAGNINAALTRTDGEIIAIFDVDHTPKPNFLEATLGYFTDPTVGFVQVMLTFENNSDGWVAQAASESSHDFYTSVSIGADALHSATLVGSNALIRREALKSVGGYQPGLAEDLETSLALHAAGWQSVYIPEPLAPGFAPPDVSAWFTQQFKWARGVFETLLISYPRYFSNLTTRQRVVYLVRMTYYWLGVVIALHLLVTALALFSNERAFVVEFEEYLIHLMPLAAMVLLIRLLALRKWGRRTVHRNLQWKPVLLVFVTWPIYTLAWLMAMLRVPLQFRPTPKTPAGTLDVKWIVIPLLSALLLTSGAGYFLVENQGVASPLVLVFALGLAVPHLLFFAMQCYSKLAPPIKRHTMPVASILTSKVLGK